MAKKTVVEWNAGLDDSIEAIGLIVGEEQPAIQLPARFSEQVTQVTTERQEELFYARYAASQQQDTYTFQVEDSVFEELRSENIVLGPALVPNKLILRIDDDGNEFYGYFTEQAVRNSAYSFQKNKLIDKFNINHDPEKFVQGVFVAESWIVEDPNTDQSRLYGYNLPKGSWFIKLKVLDDELYRELIGDGDMNLNGFSIETALLERVIFSKQG